MGNCLKPLKEQLSLISPKPHINPPISMESKNENLRVFSYKELNKATKKFRQDMVTYVNTNKTFHKGYINEITFSPSRTETGIAVSVLRFYQASSEAQQEWKEEVKSLGKISHPNLVKLFGYCCEDSKSLLVFEYFHKGSVDRYIFGKEEEALKWGIRLKIAIGAAQALAYLHSIKNSPLYRELRMYNILLDEQYNAKLFYLGSNKLCMLDESITNRLVGTRVVGRIVYLPPEYITSGHLGAMSDVYTFGVILLELLTGSRASDRNENIHDSVKPFLSDESKIREVIDPRLGNDYPVNAATQMGKLIKRCIKLDSKKRPLMQQVLDTLIDIAKIKN